MKLLLDTHVFLWWRADSPKLKAKVRNAIAAGDNEVFISGAVAWEIVIKRALGRLEFDGSVGAAATEEGFAPLPITLAHADEVARLPDLHRDPFDRLLIAQARREGLTLVSHDKNIQAYEGFDRLLA
ncbi:MAG: type II toxin-antitoxin system VapC family toxin [Deltaproteobacteria bacterium]|nr:type II toxin-antitoxin system VapC family toxin [Deltaproteobacteria bacterium]